jgi:hypothetical protein
LRLSPFALNALLPLFSLAFLSRSPPYSLLVAPPFSLASLSPSSFYLSLLSQLTQNALLSLAFLSRSSFKTMRH